MTADTVLHSNEPPSAYAEWKKWDAEKFGQFSIREEAYFEAEFAPLLPNQSKPTLLEIGFGNGSFLGWGHSKNYECCGIEVIPELESRANQFGLTTYTALDDPSLQTRKAEFDCVVAFDVLEHVEQAQLPSYFNSISALLRTGGYFVARFPNGDSPFGRVYQHGDITHVTTLGQFKLRQLAGMADFEVISVDSGATGSKGLAMMARLRQALRRKFLMLIDRALSRLYFGSKRITFSANLVAVLRKRE